MMSEVSISGVRFGGSPLPTGDTRGAPSERRRPRESGDVFSSTRNRHTSEAIRRHFLKRLFSCFVSAHGLFFSVVHFLSVRQANSLPLKARSIDARVSWAFPELLFLYVCVYIYIYIHMLCFCLSYLL